MSTPFAQALPWVPPIASMSIHEGIIGDIAQGDHTRTLGGQALCDNRIAVERARDAAIAIHGDLSLSEGGRHLKANEISYKATNRALPELDKARAAVQSALTRLRGKTAGPVADTSVRGAMVAAEVRSTLAGMTGKDRMDALTKSLDEGDDSLVGAALSESRFLTGLTAIEQAHLRAMWAQQRCPAEVERIKVLEKDMEHIDRAGGLVQSWQRQCADQNIVAAAAKTLAQREAAIAAAGNGQFVAS